MLQTLESLRAEILARYASIHAFCRMNPDLKRATVYLVLSGKYPGKTEEQAARIRAALHEKDAGAATHGPDLPREEVVLALQSIRCGHCRKLDKRGCPECRRQRKERRENCMPGFTLVCEVPHEQDTGSGCDCPDIRRLASVSR